MTARSFGLPAAATALAAALSLFAATPGRTAPWDTSGATGARGADTDYYDYAPGPYSAGPAYVAPTRDYASPYFAAPGTARSNSAPSCGAGEAYC